MGKRLNCQFNPSLTTLLRAVALLEQFIDEEQAALAIVTSLITMDMAALPDDGGREEWNAAWELFVERYPNSKGIYLVQYGKPEELVSYLENTLKPGAAQVDNFKDQVAKARLPYGILSAAIRRPYTAALLHRGAGCLPIYPGDRSTAALDRTDALAALGKQVVVDSSTLVLASFTPGLWGHIQRAFSSVGITDIAFADIVASKQFGERGDGTSVGWDSKAGRVVMSTIDPEVLVELRRRGAAVEEQGRECRQISWPSQQALERLASGEPPF